MNESHIPYDCAEFIDGETWYQLSRVMKWLKGSDTPIQINPYKNRCSSVNLKKHKSETQKGKPRVYVNIHGLREIVERTPSVTLSAKRLLGISSGITRSEAVFGFLLNGFMSEMGHSVRSQVPCGEYIIDFVIDGKLAVEYDEMAHCSYESTAEKVREAEISRHYSLIRIHDSEDEGNSIASIYKAIQKCN